MRRIATLALLALMPISDGLAQSMFRGDPAHTGVYPGQGPRTLRGVKWSFQSGDRIVSSPVHADGVVYFGSDDGYVYALDAATGRQSWKHQTGGPVPSSPALAGGVLYAASYDGKFHALNAKTGATRWKFTTGGERRYEAKGIHGFQPRNQTYPDPYDTYLSSPVVVGDSVYFGSGDGNLYALATDTGALRWKFGAGDVIHASPAYADGVLYVGSWDSWLYAVDAQTGKERWRFKTGEDALVHNQQGFQGSPAVVDGVVYVGCRDSHLYAIDAASGKQMWNFSTGLSWVITSPAVYRGKVYFATSDSSLYYVVDAATGKELTQLKSTAYLWSSPAIAGDAVYQGVFNGTLEARDLDSGALLWAFKTEAAKRNKDWILAADGSVNQSLVFRSSWRETPIVDEVRQLSIGAFLSSPLVVNGVVYAGSTDGKLYALE
jgi:outer membrane protein assembly factor BamB